MHMCTYYIHRGLPCQPLGLQAGTIRAGKSSESKPWESTTVTGTEPGYFKYAKAQLIHTYTFISRQASQEFAHRTST